MSTLERVQGAFSGLKAEVVETRDGTVCLAIAATDVHEACKRLRDVAGFETNTFVTAIDHFPKEPRFQVSWQFLSLEHNDRVRLIARVPSEKASVPTIVDLYPGTAFSERECHDMFGIGFEGHANLRRLLMPDEYGHFPLRKDFPHQGIEPDRLYREWDARRHERAAQKQAGNAAVEPSSVHSQSSRFQTRADPLLPPPESPDSASPSTSPRTEPESRPLVRKDGR